MQPKAVLFFLTILIGVCDLSLGEEMPAWLRQVAAERVPEYERKIPAVVLLNDQKTTVEEDGRVVTTTNYALRILSREGRDAAVARELYRTDTGKVRDFRAWLIRPSGEIRRFGKETILDAALINDDMYNEARVKIISCKDQAEIGAVFGYESVNEDRSMFPQIEKHFQGSLPVRLSRFTLVLPAGWQAESVTFNRSQVEPSVTGSTYLWQLGNLPYVEEEPAGPGLSSVVPRLAVSYYPVPGTHGRHGRSMRSWSDVSQWLTELGDAQAASNGVIESKVRELTAGAKTEMGRIRAIARYVQGINYISIQTGLGRGGGYRPHPAVDVFSNSYGDCKDKANLMRTMLRVAGIPAYLVAVYAGDPDYVHPEWASPQQFNHMILAVRVQEETQAPGALTHSSLGRLLIFDPTDQQTLAGDLPGHEQGSWALLVAGDAGSLTRLPSLSPAAARLERRTEAELKPDGSLTATLYQQSIGQAAARLRREFRFRQDYGKWFESWLAQSVSRATVSKLEPVDDMEGGHFILKVEFASPSYGQVMQNKLMIFKPAIIPRQDLFLFTEAARKYPVRLESSQFEETTEIKLPSGFEADEVPEPLKLEESFGSYSAVYTLTVGRLTLKRSLTTRAETIPVERYGTVRTFFDRIHALEQAPAVLLRH